MDYKKVAEEIIKLSGGKKNIIQNWHCITRLRFNVADQSKVKLEKLHSINGVLGAQFKSGQLQIIIGHGVEDLHKEIDAITEGAAHSETRGKKSGNVIENVLDVISGIFTPILPAIVGAGLLKGLLALFTALNLLNETGSNYEILHFISDATFHFLPFLLAFSAAKKFNADPSISVSLAGILMYPQIMEYAATGEVASLQFLGLDIPMASYASSVIPIILTVWLLSYVNKLLRKAVPKSLNIVFIPLLSLIITAPIMLKVLAPMGMYIGSYLESFFTTIFSVSGLAAGLLMGGLMPVIVITGMHYAFFPSTFASFERHGYDIMLLPMNLAANLAQAGAVLGVFLKTKNKKMKQISFSSFIPAVFGITEPAIYGVTLRLKKPFYASLIGGATGGAIFGALSVKATSFTIPGIMSLPTYIMPGTNNMIFALIGVVSSFSVALIITLILGFKDEDAGEISTPVTEKENNDKNLKQPISVSSPISGKMHPLSEVDDETFSSEKMGKGVAIQPSEGIVYAPFSGQVIATTPTNHAIGLRSDDGVEVLIHVGLDTVNLKGEGFRLLVKDGQKIIKGDKLIEFDMDYLKDQGVSPLSPVIVTNTPEFLEVVTVKSNEVKACDQKLLMLIK
ncbi:beta-glucoside-specific PTS transporter subunit IIABC [Salipaludibacillus sp. CUR1]|uniref:beta-glucoside-specific PTS transporter subunit IIABC n=1 Tax=Salipaludibacillus sp. CUR1 TaxID=2820003 RepID=UPI001E2C462F|nr:beta-glucoside-specific PTS transporter subunit IIABC [Salipaludibacillus sp. CUR1]MCE7792316.1 beta-glucoside-specific PTS transporter subunit IIABC [Salipaludibacillus sp. CUR1]